MLLLIRDLWWWLDGGGPGGSSRVRKCCWLVEGDCGGLKDRVAFSMGIGSWW